MKAIQNLMVLKSQANYACAITGGNNSKLLLLWQPSQKSITVSNDFMKIRLPFLTFFDRKYASQSSRVRVLSLGYLRVYLLIPVQYTIHAPTQHIVSRHLKLLTVLSNRWKAAGAQ